MSSPPPDPADLGLSADQGAGDAPPTEFWRNLMPWDDLNAKSPPERWLQFQKDVLPVLAVLVGGRTPAGSRLLAADAAGRLATSGTPYFSDRVLAIGAVLGTQLYVADASLYSVGMQVFYPNQSVDAGPLDAYVGYVAATVVTPNHATDNITVDPQMPFTPRQNDFFLIIPPSDPWLPAPPWLYPNKVPVDIDAGVASGATLLLVAAAAQQNVFLFECSTIPDTAPTGDTFDLEDTTGVIYHKFGAGIAPWQFRGYGVKLPLGRGVQLKNNSSGNVRIRGSLVYSQAQVIQF